MQENDNINIGIESIAAVADSAKKGKARDTRPTQAADVENGAAGAGDKTAEKQAYMYLGPNIPGGRLFSGNLFKCNSPDDIGHLEDLFEKLPGVKRLFVEVKKVPEFKRQLSEQGTQASGLYSQAQIEILAAIKEGVFKHVI